MNDLRMNLKVCEGCGALWLRSGETGAYCRGCAATLAEFPAPRRRRRRRRAGGKAGQLAVMEQGGLTGQGSAAGQGAATAQAGGGR